MNPTSPIHAALKKATAPFHDSVETTNPLSRKDLRLQDYRDYLIATYRIVAPVENCLGQIPGWNEAGLDFASRRRAPFLEKDLKALGVEPTALEQSSFLPKVDTLAKALGVLYVLEGSTLGGQMMFKRLSQNLGSEAKDALHYLGGSGTDTLRLWREFLGALAAFSSAHPGEDEEIVDAAVEMFRCFDRHFQLAP